MPNGGRSISLNLEIAKKVKRAEGAAKQGAEGQSALFTSLPAIELEAM